MALIHIGPEIHNAESGRERKSLWKRGTELLAGAGLTAAGLAIMTGLGWTGIGGVLGGVIAGKGISKGFGAVFA